MRFGKWIAAIVFIARVSWAQAPAQSYSFLFDENKHAWCGYANEKKFQEITAQIQPLESARVAYKAGQPSEITYQIQPESGDWIVVDKYSVSLHQTVLRRTFVFAQSGIQVIKEGVITKGGSNHLSLVFAKNSDGSKASLEDVDFPSVPIQKDPSEFPFVKLAESMKRKSLATVCTRAGHP